MKIAIPMAEGKLTAHFGHCQEFAMVYVDDNNAITKVESLTPPPHEPGVLPRWLHELNTDVIIAGGMGHKAQELFAENQIKVLTGAPVDTPENLVNAYLNQCLVTGENQCDH